MNLKTKTLLLFLSLIPLLAFLSLRLFLLIHFLSCLSRPQVYLSKSYRLVLNLFLSQFPDSSTPFQSQSGQLLLRQEPGGLHLMWNQVSSGLHLVWIQVKIGGMHLMWSRCCGQVSESPSLGSCRPRTW